MVINLNPAARKFNLGEVFFTQCIASLERDEEITMEQIEGCITRHANGDWGDVCDEDKQLNDLSTHDGTRILSAYQLTEDIKLWIITDAENEMGMREATTVMTPDEY